ncbi:MAG: porin [Pirellulales bacterium]
MALTASQLDAQFGGRPTAPPSFDSSSAPYSVPGQGLSQETTNGDGGYYASGYTSGGYGSTAVGNGVVAEPSGYASSVLPTLPVSALDQASPKKDELTERISQLEKRLNDADAAKKKLPSVQINGVFQADAVLFHQTDESIDQYGRIENGADFRRTRLSAKGSVTETMNYFVQMDFGFFGRPTFTDVWVEQTKIPYLGTVRVGQWKQPFSLETVSSFRYTTFMERSLLFQTFDPFRHIGIGFYNNTDDLMTTWAASYFRTGQDQFGGSLSTDGGNGLAGRLTHLMWYCGDKGQDYLHIGAGYYYNAPPRDTARFRTIPEIFVGEFGTTGSPGSSGIGLPNTFNGTPFFADTGNITDVNSINTFGLESLWVRGPLSWQTEAMAVNLSRDAQPGLLFGGAYSQVGYFLTGEHRPYDRKAGAIDRVTPFRNFGKDGGMGAWEVAARWSYLDVTDRNVVGGMLQDLTGGVNWYLNPYCKTVFNYVHSWSEARDFFPTPTARALNSQTDAFAMRVQLDF